MMTTGTLKRGVFYLFALGAAAASALYGMVVHDLLGIWLMSGFLLLAIFAFARAHAQGAEPALRAPGVRVKSMPGLKIQ